MSNWQAIANGKFANFSPMGAIAGIFAQCQELKEAAAESFPGVCAGQKGPGG
jgi:hypothetical protein